MESFVNELLKEMEISVLIRESAHHYSYFGICPDFYKAIFPSECGDISVTPWKNSFMLNFFVNNAEYFFENNNSEKSISSGVWQEEDEKGREYLLVASASKIGGKQAIIIRNITNDYPNHMAMLQKIRENWLQQKKLNKSLDFYKKKSSYDDLTSLYNKGTFLEILKSDLYKDVFLDINISILMIDIDDFKKINDTYGHIEGDNVLRSLGQIFNHTLRKDDIAARYGGEEFIIFAPNTDTTQANYLGEKLRAYIENYDFGNVPRVTVSIGAAVFQKNDTIEGWIKRADSALYEAKRGGKNKTVVK